MNAYDPIRPVRKDHVGEVVYIERWKHLMTNDPESCDYGSMFESITSLPPTLRRTRLCASFICWLGTTCGQSYLHEARRLEEHMSSNNAFVATWCLQNRRYPWLNSGVRTLEHLTMHPIGGQGFLSGYRLEHDEMFGEITVDDYETMEQLTDWLGSDDGKEFVRRCDDDVAKQSRWTRMFPK